MTQAASVPPALASLRGRLQPFLADGRYAGIAALVWHEGRTVFLDTPGWRYRETGLPVERDTIFRLASMTKPITSAAAMMLVEDGLLDLEAPIARWLPEAEGLKVLRTPQSSLGDVIPVERPPTLFDLMTHTAGFAWGKGLDLPICRAMDEATGTTPFVPHDTDTLVQRVCALPLICQPGTRWHYSNGSDLLGAIVARAAGQALPDILHARIFEPLGMKDTGFHVPAGNLARFSAGYGRDEQGALFVHDDRLTGFWTRPPVFPAGGGGLVSTLDDYLAFARMLLDGGVAQGRRLMSRKSVALMTSNRLRADQMQALDPAVDFLRGQGFGLGLSVSMNALPDHRAPGSFSWPGGYGTTWFADPHNGIVALLMTQVWQDHLTELASAFETGIYAALGSAPQPL